MRLRNKKTGEIATLTLSTNGEDMIIMGNDMLAHITKLSELKDFEDYEEPKDHWYINYQGEVYVLDPNAVPEYSRNAKEIGNYFGTKEEAELAVRKLKAWKRLEDRGFRFDGWDENHHNLGIIEFSFDKVENNVWDFEKDLDLLFCTEVKNEV